MSVRPQKALTQVKGIGQPIFTDVPAFCSGWKEFAGSIGANEALIEVTNDSLVRDNACLLSIKGIGL